MSLAKRHINEQLNNPSRIGNEIGDALKNKQWLLWVLLGVVASLLYPFETMVVPEWRIKIVDELEAPISSVVVRQSWQHYSMELGGHEEDLTTDDDGYVTFPRRTIKANLFSRAIVPTINTILLREHASFGPSASVTVWGNEGSYKSADYEPNKQLPSRLILPSPTQQSFLSITSHRFTTARPRTNQESRQR